MKRFAVKMLSCFLVVTLSVVNFAGLVNGFAAGEDTVVFRGDKVSSGADDQKWQFEPIVGAETTIKTENGFYFEAGSDQEPEQPKEYVMKVGNGIATDGSDEWELEMVANSALTSGTHSGHRYYVKNKLTGTYLTATANYGDPNVSGGMRTNSAPVLKVKDENDVMQKWAIVEWDTKGLFVLYANAGSDHSLGIDADNIMGMVSDPSRTNAFAIDGFTYGTESAIVKFNFKNSGKYLAVGVEGEEPEEVYNPVASETASNDDTQKWIFTYVKDSTNPSTIPGKIYTIKNKATGLYLSSDGQYYTSVITLAPEDKTGTLRQTWTVNENGSGNFRVYQPDGWPNFLDINGAVKIDSTQNYNLNLNMEGFVVDTNSHETTVRRTVGGKTFYLTAQKVGGTDVSSLTSDMVFRGNKTQSSTDSQKWQFEPIAGSGGYRIKNIGTDLYLTIKALSDNSYTAELQSQQDENQGWNISFNSGFNAIYINPTALPNQPEIDPTNLKLGFDENGAPKLEWNPWGSDYQTPHQWCKLVLSAGTGQAGVNAVRCGYRIKNIGTDLYLTIKALSNNSYTAELQSQQDENQGWEIFFNSGLNAIYINPIALPNQPETDPTNLKLGFDENGAPKLEWNPWGSDYQTPHQWCKLVLSSGTGQAGIDAAKAGAAVIIKTENGFYFEAGSDQEPEQPKEYVMKVGNGSATDGSDQWELEMVANSALTSGTHSGHRYYVKNKLTGTYLTATANYGDPNVSGGMRTNSAPVLKVKDENDVMQKWAIVEWDTKGLFVLYANAGSDHSLGIDADNKIGMVSDPSRTNAFAIDGFAYGDESRTVKLNFKNSGKYLTVGVEGEESEDVYNPIGVESSSGDDTQKWILTYVGPATSPAGSVGKLYTIKNKATGLYLSSSGKAAGSTITLAPESKDLQQTWAVRREEQAAGEYYIYQDGAWSHFLFVDTTGCSIKNDSYNWRYEMDGFKYNEETAEVTIQLRANGPYLTAQKEGDKPVGPVEGRDDVYGVSKASGQDNQNWVLETIDSTGKECQEYRIKNVKLNKYLSRQDAETSKVLFLADLEEGYQNWVFFFDTQYGHYYIAADQKVSKKLSIKTNTTVAVEPDFTGQDMCLKLFKDSAELKPEDLKDGITIVIKTNDGMYLEGAPASDGGQPDIPGSFGDFKDDTYTNGMYGKTTEIYNLLTNGGFEKQTATWGALFGGIKLEAINDPALARSGNYLLSCTGADKEYLTPSTSLSHIIRQNGDGYYQVGVYVKGQKEELASNFKLNLNLTGCKGLVINGEAVNTDSQVNFMTQRTNEVDEKGWHKIVMTLKIENTVSLSGAFSLAIWQGVAKDFYMDDCFLYYCKNSEIDGSFENGVLPVEGPFGADTSAVISTNTANSGSSSLKVGNLTTKESAPAFDVTAVVKAKGDGIYEFGTFAKAVKGQMECFGVRVIVQGDGVTVNGDTPISTGYFAFAPITDKQFSRVGRTLLLENTVKISKVYLTFYPGEERDFYLDDVFVNFYFVDGSSSGYQSSVPQSLLNRDEKTVVGAIRWDYWGTDPAQDEYVQHLNDPDYLHRLPWYAKVDQKKGTVEVPDYTQEIVDQEIAYAKQAGIDYWAFLLYKAPSDKALNYYLSSTHKNDIKWAAILGLSGWYTDAEHIQWLKEQMYQPNYQTVQNGRPLVYAEGGYATMIRNACKDMEKQPYIVSLLHTEDLATAQGHDVDAISVYTQFGSGASGSPYLNIVNNAETKWNQQKETGMQIIPNVTTGWDPRPRFENGMMGSGTHYNLNAEASEIADNLENALIWTDNNKSSTLANAILMYAWNELDEGGWIMPTYQPDNPTQPNTDRIEALQLILNTTEPKVIVTSESLSSRVGYQMPVRMSAHLLSDTLRGKSVTWSVKPLTGNGTIDAETGLFVGTKVGTVVIKATVKELPQYSGELTLRIAPNYDELRNKVVYMETIGGSEYPLEAWNKFQTAIQHAKDLLKRLDADEEISQEAVEEEIRKLDAALEEMKNSSFPTNPIIPPLDVNEGSDEEVLLNVANAFTIEELERILPYSTGKYLTFRVTELGVIPAEILAKAQELEKVIRIEYVDAEDKILSIYEISKIVTTDKPLDLTLTDPAGSKELLDKFFGSEAYHYLGFLNRDLLGASVRVYIPNESFDGGKKLYLYTLDENGKVIKTDIPVAITSDNAYVSFAFNQSAEYVLSAYTKQADTNAPEPKPGESSGSNLWLWILLAAVGVIVIAGGTVTVILVLKKKSKSNQQ